MSSKKFQIGKPQNKCPKCGNTQIFIGRCEQVAEDMCDVWVECCCGYNPFINNSQYCVESVWGSLDEEFLLMALQSWNELTASNETVGYFK